MPKPRADASERIDEYIERAPAFAADICRRLRVLVHRADPEIVEDWKWGPNFVHDGIVCGFGVFKKHVTFTFFRGDALPDRKRLFTYGDANAHNRSMKFTHTDEIEDAIVIAYVHEAVAVNARGVPRTTLPVTVPPDLAAALRRRKGARAFFDAMPFTSRKETVQSIRSARRPETRARRIAAAVERLAAGKRPD